MKILLLEDDETLAYALEQYFIRKGYQIDIFYNLKDALLADFNYDFYLIDVTLPDGLGFSFTKHLRNYSNSPIIYLTAKSDQASIIEGFDSGGDDYITKPFTFIELDKRMLALSKRIKENILTFYDLKIDISKALVTYQDIEIFLSVQEYKILLLFLQNTNKIVTRQMLNETLNIIDDNVSDNTLNVAIRRLRSKLKNKVNIETIIKKGYKLTL